MSNNLFQSNKLTLSTAITSSFSTLSGEKNLLSSTSYREQSASSSKCHIINFNVTCAGILWDIKCVMPHNSCDNINKLFSALFKDSEMP